MLCYRSISALLLVCSQFQMETNALSTVQSFRLSQRGCRDVTLKGSMKDGFVNQQEYVEYLQTISKLPEGFSVGNSRFNFKPFEVDKTLPMNVTIIMADKPTSSFAAMFTSNQFPGGPIIVGKERLKSSEFLQAIVVNNKISNVCPGGSPDRGAGDSDAICEAAAKTLNLGSKLMVLPSSTGIIGWRLPVAAITEEGVPLAAKNMQKDSILSAAIGITTTDRYPKVRSYRSSSAGKSWSVVGIAKGAGMIDNHVLDLIFPKKNPIDLNTEPNMATMLSYVLTDLNVPKATLEKCLKKAVKGSFNTISVDGDQSTSDTVLIMSSQIVNYQDSDEGEFEKALQDVCTGLAEDIVRNGEGTQHVLKVAVTGAPSDIFARDLGRFVTNSNLVKCAMAGCDPNVGRIVGAIGSFLGTVENGSALTAGLSVTLGGIDIFSNDAFQLDPQKEKVLSDYLFDCQLFPSDSLEHDRNFHPHSKVVDISIVMKSGLSGNCVVIGSDLTKEYVEVNADYRS